MEEIPNASEMLGLSSALLREKLRIARGQLGVILNNCDGFLSDETQEGETLDLVAVLEKEIDDLEKQLFNSNG